jgi:putative ABC transport system ATP-binding protein
VFSGTTRLLHDVSFAIRAGEIVTIEGPSGGGKTTLLRSLATLLATSTGEVFLEGVNTRQLSPRVVRTRVAYVPQSPAMLDGTVADNVMAGPRFRGVELSAERVSSLLEQSGLTGQIATSSAADLSGGERQRVAIARALANDPRVLLFDEPTSALDPPAAAVMLEMIRQLAVDGRAIVVVTHLREQADSLRGRHLVCEAGVLRERDPATKAP